MSMLRSSALGEMGPWRLGGTTWYCIGSALGTRRRVPKRTGPRAGGVNVITRGCELYITFIIEGYLKYTPALKALSTHNF